MPGTAGSSGAEGNCGMPGNGGSPGMEGNPGIAGMDGRPGIAGMPGSPATSGVAPGCRRASMSKKFCTKVWPDCMKFCVAAVCSVFWVIRGLPLTPAAHTIRGKARSPIALCEPRNVHPATACVKCLMNQMFPPPLRIGVRRHMYIVAIAWSYVTLMMAISEESIVAGVLTFVFYGLAPLALFLWIFGTPARRRAKRALDAKAGESTLNEVDRSDTKPDE
ncbi:MAG: collagen-like protein [Rhodocyclaceae bacterium]|nr:collagen-like protein [Rhodocyclaceae bacterium]